MAWRHVVLDLGRGLACSQRLALTASAATMRVRWIRSDVSHWGVSDGRLEPPPESGMPGGEEGSVHDQGDNLPQLDNLTLQEGPL